MHGIEIAPEFHAAAVARAERAGLADHVSFELGDAGAAAFEPGSYDAVRASHERWKRAYLRHGREHVGWAIFVGWKRP